MKRSKIQKLSRKIFICYKQIYKHKKSIIFIKIKYYTAKWGKIKILLFINFIRYYQIKQLS